MIDYTPIIDEYLKRLFPISRSIAGEGNRKTLRILQEIVPLEIKEYPTGQHVYDWTVPKEWNIKDAWIKNTKGEKVIDFQKSNLHVVSYSTPVHERLSFLELKNRLHYSEDLSKGVPYRTTFYKRDWGFCVSFEDFQKYFHENETYEVCIDATLNDGSLSIGELLIPGKSANEYLISTYICHPSMANDNLSGIILTALLAKELMSKSLNYSYRVVFVPETIGAIAYCANNEAVMKKIDAGFVITTVGGPGQFGYKQSFNPAHPINQIIKQIFQQNGINFKTYPFLPGSDERQYSSQGFRINMASITKDKYYEYDYYHTSMDNMDFVKAEYVNESLNLYSQAIDKLDKNIAYKNLYPNCEAMLSKHGLYPETGGAQKQTGKIIGEFDIMLSLLFYSDGKMTLFDISKKLNMDIGCLYSIAHKLEEKEVVSRI